MASKQTVSLEKLGATLFAVVNHASEANKLEILKACQNSALNMERDAKEFYYPASGLQRISGLLQGSYQGFMDTEQRGNEAFVRLGIRSDEAVTDPSDKYPSGFNYAVLHEYGGKYHKARKIATSAVKHQGQLLVSNLLKDFGF